MDRVIAHLNIVGFRAAVASLREPELRGRPYVIAGGSGGRAVVWDLSPEALRQNIRPGMALAQAGRMVRDLAIVAPDPAKCGEVNRELEKIITRYAPLWQNDGAGNIYLDITGTRRIFGSPADCICHIQNEISTDVHVEAAAAMATNKLVSKVASRAIRPEGFIEVRSGDEEGFLRYQKISLLPGLGPSLIRTIEVTGFRDVGELAGLSDGEAAALFGKKGTLLRDAARGIDNAPVSEARSLVISKQADFAEDVIDETILRGALAALTEDGGLQMRKDKLGSRAVSVSVTYSDGIVEKAAEKRRRLLVLDSEILALAEKLCKKAVTRRIRIRSVCLSLEDLRPLGYEPDLFEPVFSAAPEIAVQVSAGVRYETAKKWRLQEAVDLLQNRYGTGAVTRGIVLAASAMRNSRHQAALTSLRLTAL
ncbi:MAG: DNA polymerase [Treponema sp.]|nr:DNA polymerase [Treponema sp.]